MAAYQAGKYKLADKVTIAGKRVTIGEAIINNVLPAEYRQKGMIATKKNLAKLLNNLAKTRPQVFADVVSKLKDLGNQYSYESGFSIGLELLAGILLPVGQLVCPQIAGEWTQALGKMGEVTHPNLVTLQVLFRVKLELCHTIACCHFTPPLEIAESLLNIFILDDGFLVVIHPLS